MTVENKKLDMVIYYLIKKLGSRLTKTKLMKLLFISDYIAKKGKQLGIGRTITGIRYIYYMYGPFSMDVYKAIDKMNGYEISEIDMSELSKHETLYTYEVGNKPRFEVILEPKEKKIIDFVIKKYGYLPLDQLLAIIYNSNIIQNSNLMETLLE